MRIEDREEFVDQVAQAVIDKIEERDRIEGMVSLVVARVLALQQEQSQSQAALAAAQMSETPLTTLNESTEQLSEENTYAKH